MKVTLLLLLLYVVKTFGNDCLCHCPCDGDGYGTNTGDSTLQVNGGLAPSPQPDVLERPLTMAQNKVTEQTGSIKSGSVGADLGSRQRRNTSIKGQTPIRFDENRATYVSDSSNVLNHVTNTKPTNMVSNVVGSEKSLPMNVRQLPSDVNLGNLLKLRKRRSVDCPSGIHRCQSAGEIFAGAIGGNRCTGSFTHDDDFQADLRKIMEHEYHTAENTFDVDTIFTHYTNTKETDLCEIFGYRNGKGYDWTGWSVHNDMTLIESLTPRFNGALKLSSCNDNAENTVGVVMLWHRYKPTIRFPKSGKYPAGTINIQNNIDRTAWTWTALLVTEECPILSSIILSGDCRVSMCFIF